MTEPIDQPGEYIGLPSASLRGIVIRYRGHRMGGARPARVTLPSAAVTVLLGWGEPLTIHSGPEQASPGSWPAMIAGLQSAPMLAGFSGSASAVEIELTPLGAYRLLDLPLHHLAKTVIDPDHIMGASWAANATEQLAAAPHWPRRWQILDTLLARRLSGGTMAPSPAAAQAWNLLRDRDGAASLRELTVATGLGQRRIQGLLREHIGLPAQTLSRIIRFHRALAVASNGLDSLADLASQAGYHDQPHMNRDFRALSGQTPRELLDIMRRAPTRNSKGHIQSFNDFGLHTPTGHPA